MERGAASWVDEDPLPRVALWVIARLVCVVCWRWVVAVSRIAGRIQEPAMFPSRGCFVVGAAQTASTGTRTRRVVPGHSCGTTRCGGTCYRSAGITIYLGKHEGGQQRHNCACCSNSALKTERVRPAPVACALIATF
ncbi:trans-sialidase [Trypanosoma cruzi]|nr:trans-sialidase [Trypanosoma cruzi]